ncbi:hypothetical protein ACFQNE_13165 [Gordonia phosphorivorans]|uniref:Integral membrane protein n=1 Tax=Gordonia phosphorivorans TaxID=1056982 RepID=A0ABV6H3C2_9ACTN
MTDQPPSPSPEGPEDDRVPEAENPYATDAPVPREPAQASAEVLPGPLNNAVRLMYLGAALQVAIGAWLFFFVSRLRDDDEVRRVYEEYVADAGGDAQALIDSAVTNWRIGAVVATVLLTALWFLVAWAVRNGKRWARPTATGLGVLALIGSIYTLLGGLNVIAIGTVVLSSAILYLLYRPASTAYFAAVAAPRR